VRQNVVELSNPTLGIRHRQRIRVLSGKKQVIRKSFRKGFLQVNVKPYGEVFINGKSKGITPFKKPFELYEGTHTLRVFSTVTGRENYKITNARFHQDL